MIFLSVFFLLCDGDIFLFLWCYFHFCLLLKCGLSIGGIAVKLGKVNFSCFVKSGLYICVVKGFKRGLFLVVFRMIFGG